MQVIPKLCSHTLSDKVNVSSVVTMLRKAELYGANMEQLGAVTTNGSEDSGVIRSKQHTLLRRRLG